MLSFLFLLLLQLIETPERLIEVAHAGHTCSCFWQAGFERFSNTCPEFLTRRRLMQIQLLLNKKLLICLFNHCLLTFQQQLKQMIIE
jgi:hypothetical protein